MKKLFAFVATFAMAMMANGVAMAADSAGGQTRKRPPSRSPLVLPSRIAAFGAALGQGRVGAAAMESIGRNPNAADKLFLPLVLTLALLEALALYGFVIAILLQGKI